MSKLSIRIVSILSLCTLIFQSGDPVFAQSLQSVIIGNSSALSNQSRKILDAVWEEVPETAATVPSFAELQRVLERGRRKYEQSRVARAAASAPKASLPQDDQFRVAKSTPTVAQSMLTPSYSSEPGTFARWYAETASKHVDAIAYAAAEVFTASYDALACAEVSLEDRNAIAAAQSVNAARRLLRLSNDHWKSVPGLIEQARAIAKERLAYEVSKGALKITVMGAAAAFLGPLAVPVVRLAWGGTAAGLDYSMTKDIDGELEAKKQLVIDLFSKIFFDTPIKVFGGQTIAEIVEHQGTMAFGHSGAELINKAVQQPEVRNALVETLAQLSGYAAGEDTEKLVEWIQEQLLAMLKEPEQMTTYEQVAMIRHRYRPCASEWRVRRAGKNASTATAAGKPTTVESARTKTTAMTTSGPSQPAPATPSAIVVPPQPPPALPPPPPVAQSPTPPAPPPMPVPTFSGNAPELIGATFVCDGRPHIDLQWSSVRDADRYTLWRNYDWKGLIMAPGTNFRDQSINSNSMYEYWVVAERAGVKGKISNSITVKVPECSMFTAKLHAYPVGAGPYRVKTGDLNGDGHTDIVTANYLNSSVSVLLGDGRGAFESAINTDVGIGPIEPFVFDINGDHLDDIVVSNSAGTTTVLLANRDGSLKKVQTITGYISAAVDFDRDHRLDLFGAFGNWPSTWHNAVLRNNGTGTFDEVTTWRRSEQVLERATVGDFDGNGKPDVIGVVARTKGVVVFLSGNGDGTFGAPEERPLALAAEGQFSQTAHFTVGSAADAIVSTGSAFTVLSGGPGGPAREAKALPTGLDSVGVGLVNQLGFADLDRDGRDDVIVPDPTNGQVKIQLTTQTAGDMGLGSFPVGARPTAAVVADFNEDGKDDIAVANNGSATVSVLLSGEQLNIPLAEPSTGSREASSLRGADATKQPPEISEIASLPSVARNDEKEKPPPAPIPAYELFKSSVSYGVGSSPQSITLGDFNGDGAKDIAAANYNGNSISVLLAKGDGTFAPAVTSPVGRATFGIYSGNLNGDGKDDLIVGDSYGNGYAFVSQGDGTFRQTAVLSGYVQGAGDFNGDGKLDAFMAGDDNRVYLGNDDGTFRLNPWRRKSWMLQRIAVGDFNGDGKVDVAGTADPWPERSDRRPVVLLLGNGDGTFDGGHQWDLAKFHRMQWTATGDFNADGKKDLVVAHKAMSVLLGSGAGDFGAPIDFQIGTDGRTKTDVMFTETGDFNSDGRDDVVVPNAPDGSIMVRLTDPAGLGSGDTGTFPVGSAPIAIAVGDFNKDGKLDLAIVNSGSNDVSVLLHR